MQDSLLETRVCKIVYWRQGYARQFIGDKGSLHCYKCCNLGSLKIRRKTCTADTGKTSWWFVIHADEEASTV